MSGQWLPALARARNSCPDTRPIRGCRHRPESVISQRRDAEEIGAGRGTRTHNLMLKSLVDSIRIPLIHRVFPETSTRLTTFFTTFQHWNISDSTGQLAAFSEKDERFIQ